MIDLIKAIDAKILIRYFSYLFLLHILHSKAEYMHQKVSAQFYLKNIFNFFAYDLTDAIDSKI